MRLPKPKHPQHRYNPHELFTRTAAFNVFYKTTVMPLLGRHSKLPRDQAFNLLRLKTLKQIDRLNGRIAQFDGANRLINISLMLNCPVPGCMPYPRSVWYCRNRYICPACYGREMINAYNTMAPLIPGAAETGHQLFVASQTFQWPNKLNHAELSNYFTRYVHAVSLFVQRFEPVDGTRAWIKDMPTEPIRGVGRMFVWPAIDPTDHSPTKQVRFSVIGLRQRMPDGMRMCRKWPMVRQLQNTIWNGPPDDVAFGKPTLNSLVNAITRAFRYPVKLFTAEPGHSAAVLNAVTNRRLRMVRYIGLPTTNKGDDDHDPDPEPDDGF